MLGIDLRAGWSVRAIGGDLSERVPGTYQAEVPGCVHTDLMAAGVIPDPYLDGNEAAIRWMYGIDWRYATVLDPSTVPLQSPALGERVDLVFDGIDTVATIRLGDGPDRVELGRTYNMHRSYRFDISQHLTGGPVELEVDLQSATAYAEAEQERLADRPSAFPAPYNFSQDGVQLRLGLGAGPTYRRPVEAGPAGALERCAACSRDAPRDSRRRGHRSGRAAYRSGAP
jgi:beta-mannosidase